MIGHRSLLTGYVPFFTSDQISNTESRGEYPPKSRGIGGDPAPGCGYKGTHPLQFPLGLPCYDFWLLTNNTLEDRMHQTPQALPACLQRRAVCTRSRDVFNAR